MVFAEAPLAWLLLPSLLAGALQLARPPAASSRRVSLAAAGGTALLLALTVLRLRTLPEHPSFLLQHVWRMARVGPLDLHVGLVLDLPAGCVALVLASFTTWVVWRGPTDDEATGGWIELWLASLLVALLAGDLVTTAFGWQGAGLAAWGLLRERGSEERGSRLAMAALVLGAAAVFSSLGLRAAGLEVASSSPSSGLPRVVGPRSVRAAAEAPAYLTVANPPDARVFLDDEHHPLAQRTPLAHVAVPAGGHRLRVVPGSDLAEAIDLPQVVFTSGAETRLVPVGPTLVYRDLAGQVASRHLGLPIAALLFLLAAVTRLERPAPGAMGLLVSAGSLGMALLLVFRLEVLLRLAGPVPLVLAGAAAVVRLLGLRSRHLGRLASHAAWVTRQIDGRVLPSLVGSVELAIHAAAAVAAARRERR